jgi:Zn-dependent membrane protease YugP
MFGFRSESPRNRTGTAHETGHALQHADGFVPLRFRSSVVPLVSLCSRALPCLVLVAVFSGAFYTGGLLAWLVVAALGAIALFSLVTLPVEFNASVRALALLENGGILASDEMEGARKVLNAAALTYVAAAVSAVLQMLFWLLPLLGGGGGDD